MVASTPASLRCLQSSRMRHETPLKAMPRGLPCNRLHRCMRITVYTLCIRLLPSTTSTINGEPLTSVDAYIKHIETVIVLSVIV